VYFVKYEKGVKITAGYAFILGSRSKFQSAYWKFGIYPARQGYVYGGASTGEIPSSSKQKWNFWNDRMV